MKKKSAGEIMEQFSEEYQENPQGWSFWISPPSDPSETYEAYLIRGGEGFFLKLDSIFTPNPIRVGAKVEVERDQLVGDLPDFGFRKFTKEETERFLENLPNPFEDETEREFRKDLKRSQKKIREKAMNKKPVPLEPPDEPNQLAAMGPYSRGNPLSYVSEKQEELKKDLSKELERMRKREYPGYY
ncbi:hypothetical protein AKJ41_04725 [candidate division MSBL1 archaeon SCGC-AAA259O05]|uniref:Uncharacterized protein n=1 Tax=candidate division MSBL1 archaeon SCGC-AAA259O05 TaxID=1698271 RepID=A0A133V0A4_9EURY|nr:hypothetical protein AKJ41_04725 [candidate division MSBL1 archaeon SCGC-AAA259O05]